MPRLPHVAAAPHPPVRNRVSSQMRLMMRFSFRHSAATKAALCLVLLGMPVRALAQFTESIEYFHTDPIGSVRMVTGPSGEVIERRDFLPFGEELVPPPNAQPLGFGGAEGDAETAGSSSLPLNYFGARHLQAAIGRFITVDPGHADGTLTDPQSWNGYAYGRNNPLFFVDPDGRQNCPTDICVTVTGDAGRGGGGPTAEQLMREGSEAEAQLLAARAAIDALDWDASSVNGGVFALGQLLPMACPQVRGELRPQRSWVAFLVLRVASSWSIESSGGSVSSLTSADVVNAVVVGEYTVPAGPELDDYFLVTVDRLGNMKQIAMSEADTCIKQLEDRLGVRLRFGLNQSTDFASRVVYPLQLQGRPLIDFESRSGLRAVVDAFRHFGWRDVEVRVTSEISDYLQRLTE